MRAKIVVVGGTGLVGSKVVEGLIRHGCEAVAASPETGVNSITGQGLAKALERATAVVDVSNSPSFEEEPAMQFFTTSTRNLLDAEAEAGVKHHIVLSVVGAERLREGSYIRAKIAQERLVTESGMPYSIVHATQFFEFARTIADAMTVGNQVRVPAALIQPIASAEVANAVVQVAVGPPLNRLVEVAGPQRFTFQEFIRKGLAAQKDSREVVVDANARYFGAALQEMTLVASGDASIGSVGFDDWLDAAESGRKTDATGLSSLAARRVG